jgi:hypothetical protein
MVASNPGWQRWCCVGKQLLYSDRLGEVASDHVLSVAQSKNVLFPISGGK